MEGNDLKSIRGSDIAFRASIEFNGSVDEFEKVMSDLASLQEQGLMIDTTPLPEKKTSGIMIDTVPLPELEPKEVFHSHHEFIFQFR